jgi:hypothetical protein
MGLAEIAYRREMDMFEGELLGESERSERDRWRCYCKSLTRNANIIPVTKVSLHAATTDLSRMCQGLGLTLSSINSILPTVVASPYS